MTQFLHTLLNMSLTAAFVAVVVFLLRLVLKGRAARQTVCLLWLIVFARLLIPVTLQSPLSLVPDMNEVTAPAPVVSEEPEAVPTRPVNTSPVQGGSTAQNPVITLPPAVSAPGSVASAPVTEEPPAVEEPAPFPWALVLTAVWAAGVAAMLLYGMGSYLSIRRKLRFAIRTREGWWEDPHLRSPFILGLVRPKIYLPCHMTPYTRQFILCHERAHIRRGDHIIKPICWLALALHWFNPLAWAAFLLLSRDIEVACDESVLRQLGQEVKADYSATLLALATNGRFPSPTPLAFGEGDAKTRIKGVLSFKKPALWVTVAAVAVAVVAAVCLLTDPVDKFDPDKYTTLDCYPGLYFEEVTDGESGLTTVKAYRVENGKAVLVAGWQDHPADNVATFLYPDGTKEPGLSTRGEIIARYEQYLVDFMMEQDANWAEKSFTQTAVFRSSGGQAVMTLCDTPQGNLLLCRDGRAQVIPLSSTPFYPLIRGKLTRAALSEAGEDGTDRLELLWTGEDITLAVSSVPGGLQAQTADALLICVWDGENWTAYDSTDAIAYADKPVSFDRDGQTVTVEYDSNAHTFSFPEELGVVKSLSIGGLAKIASREDGDYDLTYGVYAMPATATSDQDAVHILNLTAIMKWNDRTRKFGITFTGAAEAGKTVIGEGTETYPVLVLPEGSQLLASLPEEGVYLYTDGAGSFRLDAYGHDGPVPILNAAGALLEPSTAADLRKETAVNLSGPDFEFISCTMKSKGVALPLYYALIWDGEQNVWKLFDDSSPLATLPRDIVTDETYPADPEWYYKVAETGQYELFARNGGQEILLTWGNLYQSYDRTAHTGRMNLPVMKELEEGIVAVISEVNSGTGVGVDELVVYDLPIGFAGYLYDWRDLAADFNQSNTLTYDKATNTLTLNRNGATYNSGRLVDDLSETFDLEDGFAGTLVATGDIIRFTANEDGTFTARMETSIAEGSYVYPSSIGITGFDLVWTVKFTGKGFEVVDAPAIENTAGEAALQAYASFLNGSRSAVNAHSGESFTLDQFSLQVTPDETFRFEPTQYALVDLDGDGWQEMLLDVPNYGSAVLRFDEGSIYAFFFAARQFGDVKTDGTFSASGGHADVSICRISFSGGRVYEVDQFTYSSSYDGDTVSFFVDHEPAAETEWNAAFHEWQQREGVQWFDLP